MAEAVHADIFFFITAVSVVILTIVLAIALYYVVLILRDVRAVTAKVRKASDELEGDFEALRLEMKNEGVKAKTVFELLMGFIVRQIPKARAKRRAKDDDAQ